MRDQRGTDEGADVSEPRLSVICVYNDLGVRRECLDRSIRAYSGTIDVDYVPVDNTNHDFTSAGAALNHGARLAKSDIVVFVHQDVFLHSIDRLAAVAAHLRHHGWGVLGACGAPAEGQVVGRLRDRVQLIGASAPIPVDVDSLDEVLFMARRDDVLRHPLTEDPDLAWHAYAVEYGLRMRGLGWRVGAVDLGVTHNSLTTNLDRLDVAHRRVARLYPEELPTRTTCGTIGRRESTWRESPIIRNHGWRFNWLKESALASRVERSLNLPVVLSDLRYDLDLLGFSDGAPLHLLNVDSPGGFVDYGAEVLGLTRYGKPLVAAAVGHLRDVREALGQIPLSHSVLVVDLDLGDLPEVRATVQGPRDWLVGVQPSGVWLLAGPAARDLPEQWLERRAQPWGWARRPSPVAASA